MVIVALQNSCNKNWGTKPNQTKLKPNWTKPNENAVQSEEKRVKIAKARCTDTEPV